MHFDMIVSFKSKYGLISLLSQNYTTQDLYNGRVTWAVRSCADLQDSYQCGCVQPLESGWHVGECHCDMTSWDSFAVFRDLSCWASFNIYGGWGGVGGMWDRCWVEISDILTLFYCFVYLFANRGAVLICESLCVTLLHENCSTIFFFN